MQETRSILFIFLFLFLLVLTSQGALARAPILDPNLREQIIWIPTGPHMEFRMETTLFLPPGEGPFPLLIVNHGKDPGLPKKQIRDRFSHLAKAFVSRGYAVMVPMREGFSRSSGPFSHYACNMTQNGYIQARDIEAAWRFARNSNAFDADHIIIAGQSFGGLAALAFATQKYSGVQAVINFSGGLRDRTCAWEPALIAAFQEYGALNKIPSLWLYGENDSIFNPALVSRLTEAFQKAGGQARVIHYPAFKKDAHATVSSRDGIPVLLPGILNFLDELSLPTRVLHVIADPPRPAKTNFAKIEDVMAVPYLKPEGRAAYLKFLSLLTPRAFAISPSGGWTWAEEGDDPQNRALEDCEAKSKESCQLYAIDNDVVWPNPK
jgi:dienelactone hydrolase